MEFSDQKTVMPCMQVGMGAVSANKRSRLDASRRRVIDCGLVKPMSESRVDAVCSAHYVV